MAWYGFSYPVSWSYGGPWLAGHGYRWPRVGYERRVFGLGIYHGRQVLGSRGGNPKLVSCANVSERKHCDGLPFGGVRNTQGWVHDVGLDFRKIMKLVS